MCPRTLTETYHRVLLMFLQAFMTHWTALKILGNKLTFC